MIELIEGRYLGSLCKRNHRYNGAKKSVRYTSTNNCVACQFFTADIWRKANKKRFRQLMKNFRNRQPVSWHKEVAKYQSNYYLTVIKPKRQKARKDGSHK